MVLDLSENGFNGTIPPCLGNFSANLSVDLRKNHFHGSIPDVYAKDNMLTILVLTENQLQGPIPLSLSLCLRLQVLHLGHNMINGRFPGWLDALPELQVLVLRSNRFQGSIYNNSNSQSPFPKLRIFDISHNMFTGVLPSWYFNNFNAMKNVNEDTSTWYMNMYSSYKNSDMSIGYKHIYSVTITINETGRTHLEVVCLNRTRVDLSRNRFEGPIPDGVGELTQLIELKMSNNHLTGQIPVSFSKLFLLQSLDLSSNKLTGEIPQELSSLSHLRALNLSFNSLEGRIPQGNQFEAFSNSSYIENRGLCGPPLSRKCQEYEVAIPNDGEDDSYAWMRFTWQGVLMGYAVGVFIGLAVGCVSVYRGRPNWIFTMIDQEGQKILKKYK